MSERPAESVKVNGDGADDATGRRRATVICGAFTSVTDVDAQVQQARCLNDRSNDQGKSATNILNEVSDVEDDCDKLDDTVHTSCEQTVSIADSDHLEDAWSKVLSSGQFH